MWSIMGLDFMAFLNRGVRSISCFLLYHLLDQTPLNASSIAINCGANGLPLTSFCRHLRQFRKFQFVLKLLPALIMGLRVAFEECVSCVSEHGTVLKRKQTGDKSKKKYRKSVQLPHVVTYNFFCGKTYCLQNCKFIVQESSSYSDNGNKPVTVADTVTDSKHEIVASELQYAK